MSGSKHPMKATITLELVEIALKNFAGQPLNDDLILKIKEDLDRLRTKEDFVPTNEEGAASVADVAAQAEKEAAEEQGPADEPLATDDAPAAPDATEPEPAHNDSGEPEDLGKISRPRKKYQKIIVIYDPQGKIPAGTEIMGYPIEIPEEDAPDGRTFDRRLLDAVGGHNATVRGRKHPASTFIDAMEKIPYDDLRHYGIRTLTEGQVYCLIRGAELPTGLAPSNPA